ncbi:hypothetical protein [Botrimarina sp.]|uniref:hypothetical protein n=1 Tax=Botrimarina sp. TaxID=2795802 RepID=UPI0032ED0447
MRPCHGTIFCLLALGSLVAGCDSGAGKPDPALVEALRDLYLLEVEPAGAVTPVDWHEAQAQPTAEDEAPAEAIDLVETAAAKPGSNAETTDSRVVVMGRVGGMPSPFDQSVDQGFPFREGEAAFFLVDPATAAEFESHAAEKGSDHAADCPFCSREAAGKTDAVAMVTFAGESGAPAPVDVRELFDLKEGDLAVVRGEWSLEGGLLVVAADGLFIRE